MRRPLLWLAALGLTAAVITVAAADGAAQSERPGGAFFDDNETTHESNIEAIARAGITGGCIPEGTAFCPDLDVTRAQMASFLTRALGLEPTSPTFDDVDAAGVHAANIGAIAAAGITLGCGDGVFCPDEVVTREQMASFLARALNLDPATTGPFTDVAGTHLPNVNAIAREGITLGCNTEGTLFCPELAVRRGQMASFLARSLGLEPVVLPTAIRLVGLDGTCSGLTPLCASTARIGAADSYYILEGWFYTRPFVDDDEATFLADNTQILVTLDGVGISDLVDLGVTDYFGTSVRLEGLILDDLAPGDHTVTATWMWGGEAWYTASVDLRVAG
jgi:hypothetical protein